MVGEPGMLIKAVRLHDLALRLISRAQCHRERPIEERAPSINRRAGARHGRKPEREGRSRSRKAAEPGGGGGRNTYFLCGVRAFSRHSFPDYSKIP